MLREATSRILIKQLSFAATEHQAKKQVTRRERFLAEMERVVPWAALIETVRPYYFAGKRGRPPIGLAVLRSTVVQAFG
jgi:IS5 family transposase